MLSLADLHELARHWCPWRATWMHLMPDSVHWGPAHEIGHALLSTPQQRKHKSYGLCRVERCRCPGQRCYVVELAAMRISRRLLVIVGHEDIANQEYEDTDNIHNIDVGSNFSRSWTLVRARRLWPLPTTRRGLERALKRRLTMPNKTPIRPRSW